MNALSVIDEFDGNNYKYTVVGQSGWTNHLESHHMQYFYLFHQNRAFPLEA